MDGNGSRSLGSPVGNKGHLPELTVQGGPLTALCRAAALLHFGWLRQSILLDEEHVAKSLSANSGALMRRGTH